MAAGAMTQEDGAERGQAARSSRRAEKRGARRPGKQTRAQQRDYAETRKPRKEREITDMRASAQKT